ncbi:hypothetical protein CC80DRAFT_491236 [Byssothecium circinans]|uniref:DUF4211 domain-containing protein n=1 Tax=Byssothecium circinans TaxID=147558 RepID=A0A6A5TZN9_9PLEO|nr:hypothetical protein CC80DRAFT_491236 [Byssothecium circinans]
MPPKRPLPRKRQTKINFSTTADPSPRRIIDLSDSNDSDGPSPNPPSKRRRLDSSSKRGRDSGVPVLPNGRGGMFGSSDIDGSDSSSQGTSESEGVVEVVKVEPKGERGKNSKRHKVRKPAIPEESEDEIQAVGTRKARGKQTRRQETPDEDSEDDVQLLSSKKSRGQLKAPDRTRKRRRQAAPIEESGQEEEVIRSTRKRRHRPSTPGDDDLQESQSQEGVELDDEADEKGELKEELAFLQSSPLQDRGRLRSTNTERPKSDREKALEALKKRRAGTNEPSPSATTPGRKKPVIIDSDADSDSDLEIIHEEDPDEGTADEREETEDDEEDGANVHDVFRETNEDEDFIDDEEGLIGAPSDDGPLIPLAFTGLSSAKPRDLFKYAIEWMVQKKINPAFSSDDEIYTLAFRKLDDEVKGLASSKFHSSIWTPDFTRAIKARPDFLVNEIGLGRRTVMEAHCEACNRKNHTATWEVSLTGQPYHKDSLEPISDESDDNSGTDSDTSSALSSRGSEAELNSEKPTYDALGERIPPESKTFTLGSTCKANAQVAHTLYHWRYHLNSWVVDYLVRKGHCTPKKLVKRDKWSVKKRGKYANKIVDEMEEGGEIKKLHRLYKEQVDFALEARNDYKRGWGRRA